MPFTRWSSASEPNPPFASRSATIRRARAGPIPGSWSSSAASARSTSTRLGGRAAEAPREAPREAPGEAPAGPPAGTAAAGCPTRGASPTVCAAPRGGVAGVGRRRRPPLATAESTAAICRASVSRSLVGTSGVRTARHPRAPIPRAATVATKSRARRSAGVGTPHNAAPPGGGGHHSYADRITYRARGRSRRPRPPAGSARRPCRRCPRGCGDRRS